MEYHGLKFLGYGSNFHVLPTVSNLKGKSKELGNSVEQLQQHGYIYIGRSMNQGGWKLAKSKWSNPSLVKQSTREQCLLDYVNHLYESSLINIIVELERTHLMCWCHPELVMVMYYGWRFLYRLIIKTLTVITSYFHQVENSC